MKLTTQRAFQATLFLFFLCQTSNAQELFGVGTLAGGSVFSIELDGSNPQKLVDFTHPQNPRNGRLLDYDGKLWGVTKFGGPKNFGTIFTIEYDGTGFTVVKEFDGENGAEPATGLIYSNGLLWGMATNDNQAVGVIYTYSPSTDELREVHNFVGSEGSNPTSILLESNNRIWGLIDNYIFNITSDDYQYTTVHTMDGSALGGLIEAGGKLWGMTRTGGGENSGTIFSIETDGTGFTIIHEFDQTNGSTPRGELLHYDNKLWGTTAGGGENGHGVLFNIEMDGTSFNKFHDFDNTNGGNPDGNLVESNGKLWGLCTRGGDENYGIIFSVDESETVTNIHDFGFVDGSDANGSLVAANGLLYGLTESGGKGGSGVIFSVDPINSSFEGVIHDFVNDNGSEPSGSLLLFENKLWGMTTYGGTEGYGLIFHSALDGSDYTIVHSFSETDGAYPHGSLIHHEGKFLGLTEEGGENGLGVLFSLSDDGTGYTVEHHFDGTDGQQPLGSLIQRNGILYGTTSRGGVFTTGVIFRWIVSVSTYEKLFDFTSTNGTFPSADLTYAGEKLWGTTQFGGNDEAGSVFSINTDGTGYSDVLLFDRTNGSNPVGNLVESNGKLWGMTPFGGTANGVIYNIDLADNSLTVVHEFDDDEDQPHGSLLRYDGKLWGMTKTSGFGFLEDYGSIFSIDNDGTNYQKFYDLTYDVGGRPDRSALILSVSNTAPTDILLTNNQIPEEEPEETLIGLLSSIDAYPGDEHTYEIAGEDASKFIIDGNQLLSAEPFDYSEKELLSIVITSTDLDGLSFVKDFEITVTNVLGLENESNASVYPNPSDGSFTLMFDHSPNEIAYHLFNLSGKRLTNKAKVRREGTQVHFDFDDLAEGMYTLQLETEFEKSVRRILIKK